MIAGAVSSGGFMVILNSKKKEGKEMKRFLCVLCLVCLFVTGAAAESAYDPFVPETLIEAMGQVLPLVLKAENVTDPDVVKEVTNYLDITYTEAQDSVLFYNNGDWKVELSFFYNANPGRYQSSDAVNLVLSRELSQEDMRDMLYTFAIAACYDEPAMDADELYAWMSKEGELSDTYETARGTFSHVPNDASLQIALFKPADGVPLTVEKPTDNMLLEANGLSVQLLGAVPYATDEYPAALQFNVRVINASRREMDVVVDSALVDGADATGLGIYHIKAGTDTDEEWFLLYPTDSRDLWSFTNAKEAVITFSVFDRVSNKTVDTETVYLDLSGIARFTPAPTARPTATPRRYARATATPRRILRVTATPRPTATPRRTPVPTAAPRLVSEITALDFSNRQWAEWDFSQNKMRARFEMTAGSKAVKSYVLYVYGADRYGNRLSGQQIYFGTTSTALSARRTAYSNYITIPDNSRLARIYCGIKKVTLQDGTVQEVNDGDIEYFYWEIE